MNKKILMMYGGVMSYGGMESYMMNYFRNVNKNDFQIDFVQQGNSKGVYDTEIEEMGGNVLYVTPKNRNIIKNIIETCKIIKQYDVIHVHMDAFNYVYLLLGKLCGVKVRISHSHNTKHLTSNWAKLYYLNYFKNHIYRVATNLFACSELAGNWLYGDRDFEVIPNAIEYEKYKFNMNYRNEIRNSLNILDELVVGHVGRFDYQKNHKFLIEIFSEVVKINNKAKLLLVGDGDLKMEIEEIIKERNLTKNVILLGNRSDVYKLYNAFDVLILPSLFEGLPVVLVEAQANGLTCLVSDVVTNEVNIMNKINFMSLDSLASIWGRGVTAIDINLNDRLVDKKEFVGTGYEILTAAKKMENIYNNLVRE